MRCKLRGKYYSLKFAKLEKRLCGQCDWDKRTISINERLSGEIELDTLIHELLHACQPDLAEETVTETATDIARVLFRLGYRRS